MSGDSDIPKCFNSIQSFTMWMDSAARAREYASPCSDCNKSYKSAMKADGRCHESQVKAKFSHIHITIYEKAQAA